MTSRRNSSKKTAPVSNSRLEYESDGRAVFIAEGMRAPAQTDGPYVGRRFIQGQGKPDRNPISLQEAEGSVNAVIKQWAGLNCGVSVPQQRQNLTNFYNIVYGYEYAGADLIAALRDVKNILARSQGIDVYIPSRGKTRLSRLQISDTTTGTRGKSQDAIKPSFMWDFVVNNCDNLDAINLELQDIAADSFGFTLDDAPDYSKYTSDNKELAAMVANSNNCAEHRGEVLRLLDDIDYLHLNGQDIQAFFRVFTMRAGGPVLNPAKYRVDNLSFSAETAPSTRRRTSTKAPRPARVKASLLWYLVQNYCANLPVIVPELEAEFGIPEPEGITRTRVQVQRSPISKTQSLAYVNPVQGAAAASRRTGKVDQPGSGFAGTRSTGGTRQRQTQQQYQEQGNGGQSGSDTESDGEPPATVTTASRGRLSTATGLKRNRSNFGRQSTQQPTVRATGRPTARGSAFGRP